MDEILDHDFDEMIVRVDGNYIKQENNENSQKKWSTKRWKFLVSWKDGTTTWVPLKDLKESHPIQIAEYAIGNKIDSEPGLSWWVHDVLHIKDRILGKSSQNIGYELISLV